MSPKNKKKIRNNKI